MSGWCQLLAAFSASRSSPNRGRDRLDPRQAAVIVATMAAMTSPPSSFLRPRPLADRAGDEHSVACRRRVCARGRGADPRARHKACAGGAPRPNSAFDHGGNIAIALVAGGVGTLFSQRVVFLLVPVFAALTSAAVLMIPPKAIDHDRARDLGKDGAEGRGPTGYGVLFRTRPLMIFAVSALFFHFANAPLLPLVGQKLALQYPKEATAMLSFCMVAAQGVMLPIALLVGWRADRWGRRPIFLMPSPSCRLGGALHAVRQRVLAPRRAIA